LANQMLTAKTTTSTQEIVSKIYGSRLWKQTLQFLSCIISSLLIV
jgi:hypothetical protein